ncbi:hypothetical protein [Chryseobacterium sp. CFBP8996]|uniref:hypothetical protein n=1 Tax=Chryseobacterium sp. CFBP8996 TaxID=3096529 RepID=UPI002A6B0017|nr:hypothetical protein [Chryseobacterium sp. CFBP8996]MDY0931535.1 hypothetical protein [Chryseobacterium sp. CFBP8996]
MKIRFKNKERAAAANLYQDEYLVVAKEQDLRVGYSYVFFNENLQEMKVKDNAVEITDDNMNDMIQRNDLWYGGNFYINQLLVELLDLKPGDNIGTRHIWSASKCFRFFEKYNYEIPDSYKNTALNETYKINLIEGFLMAVNPYIERKFFGGEYFESFGFYKGKAISEINLKLGESINELNVEEYKELLKSFIKRNLHDTQHNEENSELFSDTLFILIDSLFIYDITRIFSYKTFYDDCFVIEHQNEYYYLNQFWY